MDINIQRINVLPYVCTFVLLVSIYGNDYIMSGLKSISCVVSNVNKNMA